MEQIEVMLSKFKLLLLKKHLNSIFSQNCFTSGMPALGTAAVILFERDEQKDKSLADG